MKKAINPTYGGAISRAPWISSLPSGMPAGQYCRFSNHPYRSPSPGRLPLIAFLPNGAPEPVEPVMAAHMRECGINTAITSVTLPKISQDISASAREGIRTIVMHSHLGPSSERAEDVQLKLCGELVDSLAGNPDVAGFMIGLHPAIDAISRFNPFAHRICGEDSKGHALPGTAGTQAPLLTMLLPEQAVPPAFRQEDPSPGPESYLVLAQKHIGPGVWFGSTAHTRKNQDGTVGLRIREHLNNLELYSIMSRYTLRPFWIALPCEGAAYTLVGTGSRVNEKASRLKYGALTSLAYGAQGLAFTNFRQELKPGSSLLQATLLPTWEDIAPVTGRIRELEGVFLGSVAVEVFHKGRLDEGVSVTQYEGKNVGYDRRAEVLYSHMHRPVGPLLDIDGGDAPLTVSHLSLMPGRSPLPGPVFGDDAIDFLVIVNGDTSSTRKVSMRLSDYYRVTQVTDASLVRSDGSRATSITEKALPAPKSGVVEMEIGAGDCLVLRWR